MTSGLLRRTISRVGASVIPVQRLTEARARRAPPACEDEEPTDQGLTPEFGGPVRRPSQWVAPPARPTPPRRPWSADRVGIELDRRTRNFWRAPSGESTGIKGVPCGIVAYSLPPTDTRATYATSILPVPIPAPAAQRAPRSMASGGEARLRRPVDRRHRRRSGRAWRGDVRWPVDAGRDGAQWANGPAARVGFGDDSGQADRGGVPDRASVGCMPGGRAVRGEPALVPVARGSRRAGA